MRNNILVILGMHRSGTSLITAWLQKCGLHIGETLLGPGTGNVEGHFEDTEFLKMHKEFLESKNEPETGLITNAIADIGPGEKTKLRNLVTAKNEQRKQWGWKDPRTCLFLNVYRKVLPGAHYLVIVRDYRSTVTSLVNRDHQYLQKYYLSKGKIHRLFLDLKKKYRKEWLYKTRAEQYLKIWITYNEELLTHIERLPSQKCIAVNHHTILQNDKAVFSLLTRTWKFTLNYCDLRSIYNPNLVTAPVDIDPFINDAELLKKAKLLESKLQYSVEQFKPVVFGDYINRKDTGIKIAG